MLCHPGWSWGQDGGGSPSSVTQQQPCPLEDCAGEPNRLPSWDLEEAQSRGLILWERFRASVWEEAAQWWVKEGSGAGQGLRGPMSHGSWQVTPSPSLGPFSEGTGRAQTLQG